MGRLVLSFQVKQAITSGLATLVALLAIWGVDASVLNDPRIQGIILTVVAAAASFLVKEPSQAPSLQEAYHVVQAAEQAREHERWRADAAGAAGLRDDDGFKRPDAPQQ
ncbi:hypothetical protein [uncultured Methylobacterium sp.]|jgi:hypothetical protein|uniref:hypothetical protein n=1 Tax=uncultured Methylobacterium sp. TaxID=157278 RepID=UPI00261CE73C|nr:hypothetical protein [uncultured Methylobacterium sp.]